MTYGYCADILQDLERDYMDEYEFMEAVLNELEQPSITHDEYVQGIEAITLAERKALILDLVENWAVINSQIKAGHDMLDYLITKHQIYDMTQFDLILNTVDRLFKI